MKKQARGEQTMARVLDAALACAERGDASIHALAKRSGVSVGSLYHHFGSHERVHFALYRRCLEAMLAYIAAGVVGQRTARAGVHALVRRYLDFARANPREARFVFASAHTELVRDFRPELDALAARVTAPIAAWLQPFVDRGEVVALPPALFEVVLIGPAAEATRRILTGTPGLTFASARRTLPGLVWASVATSRP